jgi:RND family efflux transporter MFP subunit
LAASAFAEPPEVAVVKPVERELKDETTFVGHTDASTTVEIRARDSGLVENVLFKEGSTVKKGEILFQLDNRIRKAEMDKAAAEVAVAEAKLKGAEAELQRARKLLEAKAISQEEYTKFLTVLEEAKAAMLASRASLEVAKLNLERTRIVAPIDGRIGRSHVDAGNIVKGDGGTLLATIIVADPLYVYFEIDDRSLLRLMKLGKDAQRTAIVIPGGDSKSAYDATIDFVDNKVNNNAIRVRATLPNPKGELLPGLYAKVRVAFGPSRKVLCLPRSTIAAAEEMASVLVVGEKNVLVERKVRVGPSVGDLRAIEEGVKADDVVVLHRQGRKAGDEIKPRSDSSGKSREN